MKEFYSGILIAELSPVYRFNLDCLPGKKCGVIVDNDICTGCGLCASICPDAFDMSNEGKAVPRHKSIPSWYEQEYQNAADNCPENAIKIYCQV